MKELFILWLGFNAGMGICLLIILPIVYLITGKIFPHVKSNKQQQ